MWASYSVRVSGWVDADGARVQWGKRGDPGDCNSFDCYYENSSDAVQRLPVLVSIDWDGICNAFDW